MRLKRIKDMFNDSGEWISATGITIIGEWSDLANTQAVDKRLLTFFGDKAFDMSFQHMTNSEISAAVTAYIDSIVYELDGLFATTELEYNPIENYNMTESGRDETRSTSSGNTTMYSTAYNDTNEAETGKSAAGGSSNTALIHSFSRSGNVGVTTSQQMLEAQRDVVKFDFIGYVCDKIIENFTMTEYFPEKDLFEVIL